MCDKQARTTQKNEHTQVSRSREKTGCICFRPKKKLHDLYAPKKHGEEYVSLNGLEPAVDALVGECIASMSYGHQRCFRIHVSLPGFRTYAGNSEHDPIDR